MPPSCLLAVVYRTAKNSDASIIQFKFRGLTGSSDSTGEGVVSALVGRHCV